MLDPAGAFAAAAAVCPDAVAASAGVVDAAGAAASTAATTPAPYLDMAVASGHRVFCFLSYTW